MTAIPLILASAWMWLFCAESRPIHDWKREHPALAMAAFFLAWPFLGFVLFVVKAV
jgi:hypothetical protein